MSHRAVGGPWPAVLLGVILVVSSLLFLSSPAAADTDLALNYPHADYYGQSVQCYDVGTNQACTGSANGMSDANTSTNTLTTRKVLFFIEAPFCDGFRRASARRCRRSWAAAGEGDRSVDRKYQ